MLRTTRCAAGGGSDAAGPDLCAWEMEVKGRLLWLMAAAAAIGLLAGVFAAYQHPSMLIDFSNLVFCG